MHLNMFYLGFRKSYIFLRSVNYFCKSFHRRSLTGFRSSHGRCSIKKVFLGISQNSLENTCARVSFFSFRHVTLLKKRLWHRCFHVSFGKVLRIRFFKEHLQWLLLSVLNTTLLKTTPKKSKVQ